MVAILIVGAIAYLQLPLSALPEVAYPTIQVQTFYPGASPEVITSAITAPLEKQFGQMPGLNQMSSTSSGGASVITLQFNLALAIDVAEQEVQAAISAAQNLLPQDLPAPPIYAKVNPADAPVLILGITSKVMPLTEVEDLADTRIAQKISQIKGVGRRQHQRRPAPGGAGRGESARHGRLRFESRRSAHDHQQCQPERAEGHARRPDQRLHGQHQRSDQKRRRLRQCGDRLQKRGAGAASRCRHAGLGRGERQTRRLDEHDPGLDHERAAPARSQRGRRGRQNSRSAAVVAGRHAGGRGCHRAHRPHHDHQGLGRRRRIRIGARRGAGGAGDLSVPAQCSGHHHSQPVGAAVADRHLRRHVSGEFQPEQSVADGIDDRDRLRRRRCHRDDRKYLPLHRAWIRAARGRAQRRRANRLHHHFTHRVADRGADSAAVHARCGRSAVSRVRGDARGHDFDFRGRVADAGADAVRKTAQAPAAGGRAGANGFGPVVRGAGRMVRAKTDLGARSSARNAVRRGRDARAHGASLRVDSEGLLSGTGHRIDSGRVRGQRIDLLRGHGGAPADPCRRHSRRHGRREPLVVHRH